MALRSTCFCVLVLFAGLDDAKRIDAAEDIGLLLLQKSGQKSGQQSGQQTVQQGGQQSEQERSTVNGTVERNASVPGIIKGLFGLFGVGRPERPHDYDDIFMRYMPKRNVVICGCAKCGTSSLYEYIYQTEFHTTWAEKYNKTMPYVHEVAAPRWRSKFWMISDPAKKKDVMESAFSFAIIRDPKERLLSAWKSKIACGCGEEVCDLDTDVATRPMMVRRLLEIGEANITRASENSGQCMTLEQFLRIISKIHNLGKAQMLDRHFLPQGLGCFFEYPPSAWSKIVSLSRPGAVKSLASKLGTSRAVLPHSHTSRGKVLLSAEAVAFLDEITVPEYELLGEYLDKENSFMLGPTYPLKPGIWA